MTFEKPRQIILRLFFVVLLAIAINTPRAVAGMVDHIDLTSDKFTKSDYTRAEIEKLLADLPSGETLDLSGKRLNGIDLSGLDLSRTKLQSARLNGTDLSQTNLSTVVLDQAWALKSDFTGAKLDGADFSHAMVSADMSRASLKNANFSNAMLAPDLTNQSMGLMRGVLQSANLEGASFKDANLSRTNLEFAILKNVDFTGADLSGSELAGADLSGSNISGATLTEADVNSAKFINLKGKDESIGFNKLKNGDRAKMSE